MKIHKLKLNAKYYEDSERGIKTFEIRKNDRDYNIGDVLELREYIEDIRGLGYYTGNVHWKIITYILDDDLYLAPGYVCLGLSPIAEPEQEEAVAIVEKWSAKHPVKTRQSEFLKMFPDAMIDSDTIVIKPCEIDDKIECISVEDSACLNCRRNYWLAEVE